jgi:hypothetical protein
VQTFFVSFALMELEIPEVVMREMAKPSAALGGDTWCSQRLTLAGRSHWVQPRPVVDPAWATRRHLIKAETP